MQKYRSAGRSQNTFMWWDEVEDEDADADADADAEENEYKDEYDAEVIDHAVAEFCRNHERHYSTVVRLQSDLLTAAALDGGNRFWQMKDMVEDACRSGFPERDVMVLMYNVWGPLSRSRRPRSTYPRMLLFAQWLLQDRGAHVPACFRDQPQPWRPVVGAGVDLAIFHVYQRELHYCMARTFECRERREWRRLRGQAECVVGAVRTDGLTKLTLPWAGAWAPEPDYRAPLHFGDGATLETNADCVALIRAFDDLLVW